MYRKLHSFNFILTHHIFGYNESYVRLLFIMLVFTSKQFKANLIDITLYVKRYRGPR